MSVTHADASPETAHKPEAAAPVVAPVPLAPVPLPPQTLEVGAADDHAEHDADRRADTALARLRRMVDDDTSSDAVPDPHQHSAGCGHLRRTESAAPTGAIGYAGGAVSADTDARISAMRGGGSSLSAPVLRRMETAFGTSFSGVKIHDGAASARLNREVSAKAFTTGKDIFFGAGEFRPDTAEGERTLAHELAHTLQPDGGVQRSIMNKLRNMKDKMADAVGSGGDEGAEKRREAREQRDQAEATANAAKATKKAAVTSVKHAEQSQEVTTSVMRQDGVAEREADKDNYYAAGASDAGVQAENQGRVTDTNKLFQEALEEKEARSEQLITAGQAPATARFKAGQEVFALPKYKAIALYNPAKTIAEQLRLDVSGAGAKRHATAPAATGGGIGKTIAAGPDAAKDDALMATLREREKTQAAADFHLNGFGRGQAGVDRRQEAAKAAGKGPSAVTSTMSSAGDASPLVAVAQQGLSAPSTMGSVPGMTGDTSFDTEKIGALNGGQAARAEVNVNIGLGLLTSLVGAYNDGERAVSRARAADPAKRTQETIRAAGVVTEKVADVVQELTKLIEAASGTTAIIPGWGVVVAGLTVANSISDLYEMQGQLGQGQLALEQTRLRQHESTKGGPADPLTLDALLGPMRFAVTSIERQRNLAASKAATSIVNLGGAIASAVTAGAGSAVQGVAALGSVATTLVDLVNEESKTKDARVAVADAQLALEGGAEAMFLKDPRMAAAGMISLARDNKDTIAKDFLVKMGLSSSDIDDPDVPLYDLLNQLLQKLDQTPDKVLLKEKIAAVVKKVKEKASSIAGTIASGLAAAGRGIAKGVKTAYNWAKKKLGRDKAPVPGAPAAPADAAPAAASGGPAIGNHRGDQAATAAEPAAAAGGPAIGNHRGDQAAAAPAAAAPASVKPPQSGEPSPQQPLTAHPVSPRIAALIQALVSGEVPADDNEKEKANA